MLNICNNLFGRNQDLPLPAYESNQDLADSVKNFVIDKISRIRNNLKDIYADTTAETMEITKDLPLIKLFRNFIPVDYNDIVKVVKVTLSKRYKLDPIPMEILK